MELYIGKTWIFVFFGETHVLLVSQLRLGTQNFDTLPFFSLTFGRKVDYLALLRTMGLYIKNYGTLQRGLLSFLCQNKGTKRSVPESDDRRRNFLIKKKTFCYDQTMIQLIVLFQLS